MIDFDRFEAITFDCYGTLIDWEAGILAALRPGLTARSVDPGADVLLESFARHEARHEQGPYLSYREVLTRSFHDIVTDLRLEPSAEEAAVFSDSVGEWPAFADSTEVLQRLGERYRLGVITNCDDDLFERSRRRLDVELDWVVTAQQAAAYKPSTAPFELAFARIGLPRARILHVAQSHYHDHVPAKALGLTTVWVDRRAGKAGSGATPAAAAVPDARVVDLAGLADLVLPARF